MQYLCSTRSVIVREITNPTNTYNSTSLGGQQAAIGTLTRRKNSSMCIKLSPSAVHSGTALASLLCAGKFKVGYFLDSLRMDWFGLAQDGGRWRTLVSAVMNLKVL